MLQPLNDNTSHEESVVDDVMNDADLAQGQAQLHKHILESKVKDTRK